MTSKKHRMIVYGVAVQLLLIAIVCYAAFPVTAPEEPIRLMYHTNAGKVLFDHKTHTGEKGIGLDCFDCHHHPPDDESALIACGQCHLPARKRGLCPKAVWNAMTPPMSRILNIPKGLMRCTSSAGNVTKNMKKARRPVQMTAQNAMYCRQCERFWKSAVIIYLPSQPSKG
jgi:hypothetical protein